MTESTISIPRGDLEGFRKYWRYDMVSGLLVFLIALPLCLGISLASGFPPLAGVFTAIIGSILTTMISNSELTIKGPAAGLIVIVLGCVTDFGGDGWANGGTSADIAAYRATLAVGCAAAILQMMFGIFRAGILGEFFPVSSVHGMLAAIGVIIISKQIPVALGVTAKGEPLELLAEIPKFIREANPAIASIGLVSLLIMFFWPVLRKRIPFAKAIPAPLIVVLVSVAMGAGFHLVEEHHDYMFQGHRYPLNEQFLVKMPDQMFGMFNELTLPQFSALQQPKAWKWVMMFFIIGSLESLLSAKAIDLIDPWKRKTNMDRDILAVGVANLATCMVGGLPMISEIVRSKANIDNGARTRFADLWHGLFLLLCVAFIPFLLHRIPLAALAAMLVYTGYRLAHPSEFLHVYRIGREQLIIFVTTLVAVLATDLLIGIAIGIAVKILIHLMNGAPLRSLFRPSLEIESAGENTVLIRAHHSAVFSNWIPFRRQIESLGLIQHQNIQIDFSNAKLVDHTTLDKLHAMERDFEQQGLKLEILGLDMHRPMATHATSARKKSPLHLRRLTITATSHFDPEIADQFIALGAASCLVIPCHGRAFGMTHGGCPEELTRIEVLATPEVSEQVMNHLQRTAPIEEIRSVCLETVRIVPMRPQVAPTPTNGQLVEV